MTPQDAVPQLLAAGDDLSPDVVELVARYVTAYPEDTADIGWNSLVVEKSAGDKIIGYSRHPYNFVFNWRELMIEVAAITGQVSVSSDPISPILGGCIRTIPKLLKATEVKLGDLHTKAVLALWADRVELNPVPRTEADSALAARGLTPPTVGQVLKDLAILRVIRIEDDGSIRKRDKLILKAAG